MAKQIEVELTKKSYPLHHTWTSKTQLRKHYLAHVLRENEEFNGIDPKFTSNMTIEEYRDRAENLANVEAVRSDSIKGLVIGWQLQPREGDKTRTVRCIKMMRGVTKAYRAEGLKGKPYKEAVIYVQDTKTGDCSIISYFILKPTYFFKLKQQYVGELPENVDKVTPEEDRFVVKTEEAHETEC